MSTTTETPSPTDESNVATGSVSLFDAAMSSTALTATQLSVRCLTSEEAFQELADAWEQLSGDIPFRRPQWCEAWWRHYHSPQTELLIVAVEDQEGHLVGLAPWYQERTRRDGRVIRFLGSGEVCSDYVTILSIAGAGETVAQRIASWLNDDYQGAWDSIELDGVAEADPSIAALASHLESTGASIDHLAAQQCWRIEFPANWDEYLSRLSRKRRERVRSFVRRMFDSKVATWQLAETDEEVTRGYEILIDLHQRRRNSLEEDGCFASNTFTEFHREMLHRLAAEGRARIHWIEMDGVPIAVEYDLIGAETVYVYQTGIDPEAMEHSPGWLSAIASIRSALDGGFASFDFLRGDEPYKATLRGEPVAMQTVQITARNPGAQVRRSIRRSIRSTKDFFKQRLRRS